MVGGITADDFVNFPLADFGVTVTRTPVTKSTDFYGQETLTEGSTENITAIINPRINQHTQLKLGLQQSTTGYIMVAPNTTILKDDKITYGSETFRVVNVKNRNIPATVNIYKFCEIVLIDG